MTRGVITTKLHILAEYVDLQGRKATQHAPLVPFLNTTAHFVVHDSITELMCRPDAEKSIRAVLEAGYTQLPFSPLLIEFEHIKGFREFVFLEQQGERIHAKAAYLIDGHIAEKGSFAATMLKLHKIPMGTTFGITTDDEVWIDPCADGFLFQSNRSTTDGIIESLQKNSTFALSVAYLVLNMQGIEKEVIECPALNKHRLRKNKPPVPRHTSLYIGRVWRRDGSSVKYDAGGNGRAPMRVHWRCAHTRNQRVGPGRKETKLVLIPAILVNYHPGDEQPAAPKMILRA